jgi:tRNA threonylcarbamoyl adenosine modification protein (Sua5/YciO/YrdC/YwlC family)
MAQHFSVHPDNPQIRLLKQATALLDRGGIVAVPTDSSYALACHLDDKAAADQLRRIRGVDEKHHLTLLCRDLRELANYAIVDNQQFRLLKQATPGPFTFILEATKEVPRRLSHPQRKTIGLRVPDHKVLQELLALHSAPLLATTLIPPGESEPLNDAQSDPRALRRTAGRRDRRRRLPVAPTTVVDMTGDEIVTVVRQGRGEPGHPGPLKNPV